MTIRLKQSWLLGFIPVMALVIGVSACSNTWEGAKEDTKENVEATGEGIEKTGESIQKSVK